MHTIPSQTPFTTLRLLKGTPITILLALWLKQAPVDQRWISATLGYDTKTVRKTLDFLEASGYVERANYRQWQLPGGQLMLPGFYEVLSPVVTAERGKSPLSAPTTTTIPIPSSTQDAVVAVEEAAPSGRISLFTPDPAVTQALRSAGIGEPTRSRLAQLDHVTLEYVKAHVAKARRDHIPTGLLVHRIRSNDLQPTICPQCGAIGDDPHAHNCPIHRQRYLTEHTQH